MLFDTHAHLTDDAFDQDRTELIEKLQTAEMKLINCGYDLYSNTFAVDLAQRYDFMYAAAGMHPHDAKLYDEDFEKKLEVWLALPKVVALGEIGLDFHYDHSPREVQRAVFIRQLEIARSYGKPVVIHSREASQETYDILKIHLKNSRFGILHSFSQSTEMMKQYYDLGMYFSISGVVTFNNAANLRETVKQIPTERLLIETDCPYMTPAPHRGKRNDPLYVKYIAEKIAEIKEISYETLSEITWNNAVEFFGIDR